MLGRKLLRIAVAVGVSCACVAMAGTASAAEPDTYCVLHSNATGNMVDGSIELAIDRVQCYPTFSDYAFQATHGQLRLPSNTPPDEAHLAQLASIASTSIVARGFDGTRLTGQFVDFEVPSATGCNGGVSWYWNVITPAWNNRISSFKANYVGCYYGYLWDWYYLSGSTITTYGVAYGLGAMNNATGSLKVGP